MFKAMGLEDEEEGEDSCKSSSSDASGDSDIDSESVLRNAFDSDSNECDLDWIVKFGGRSLVMSQDVIRRRVTFHDFQITSSFGFD
jgi:hypothetical protein